MADGSMVLETLWRHLQLTDQHETLDIVINGGVQFQRSSTSTVNVDENELIGCLRLPSTSGLPDAPRE
ncbi:hypothetical protein Tdes44962_MAKER10456 [Teratosphaeria destructans]|uniref:Uncharacterized protein n=1 Tax=Teratosphaeria destructans TaxID=418781 RepID=A0A9W7SI38_9PEZI|nr:hypothetical protein Tdes44962_MAKER10456 [Teratosphaeria destructans]